MKRRLVNERFSEANALKNLLKSSKEFIKYYADQRQKITSHLKWEKAYDLGELSGRAMSVGNDVVIQLRRMPIPLSDAHLVAHEMQHVVHREHDKIPIAIWTHPELQAGSIASSVHDLLVERDLLHFDFDVFDAFNTELSEKERTLKTIANEPDGTTERGTFILWSVNYASNIADHELIKSEYGLNESPFLEWYESKYPNTAAEGKKIYDVLGQVDLESKESIHNYQDWVIKEYNLGEWIKIKV